MLGKLRRRRFGEILVGDGLITQQQLEEALQIQTGCGDSVGAILLDLGYITESDIAKALSVQYQLPCLRPVNYDLDRRLLEPFDAVFLHSHLILPFDKIGNLLLVLLHDIPPKEIFEETQKTSGNDLAIYLGTATEIKKALMEMAPISERDEERVRQARREPKQVVSHESSDVAEITAAQVEGLDLSSEKLLSSLDAAWESIFVESSEGAGDDSDDD